MKNGKKILILFVVIIAVVIFVINFGLDTKEDKNNERNKIESTEKSEKLEKTEKTTKTEEKSDTTEDEKQIDDATEETNDKQQYATDATTAAKRESKEADELFRICLAFIEEYDLDNTDFQIEKALMVQDLSHDYMYFQCKHDGSMEYVCYTYDGSYFRDDISQKEIKKEYEKALVTMKSDQDEYNVYYEYSKEDIAQVNDMF